MTPLEDALRAIVKGSPAGWSDQDLALAARVAADVAVLAARKATGDDVDKELGIARASAANLAAAATVGSAVAITEAVTGVISSILKKTFLL